MKRAGFGPGDIRKGALGLAGQVRLFASKLNALPDRLFPPGIELRFFRAALASLAFFPAEL